MRKIKENDTISHCVHIGEVIKYNPGDGFYYDVVAINKPQGEICSGCIFNGYNCGVWFNDRLISICCTDVNRTSPGKFCKFVRAENLLEEL